ncbi:MAG: hypothetical protein IJN96_06695 [Clostridia bacterium]|nr:hypothetical protein [Clostridia bacterium]
MKRFVTLFLVLIVLVLGGCAQNDEMIIQDDAKGNDAKNVDAAKTISELESVRSVAVMSDRGVVIAGLKLDDEVFEQEVCSGTLEILREKFPGEDCYIVGADEKWADDVIELCLYTDSGMDKDILEKRFNYLVHEKMNQEQVVVEE